MAPEEIDRVTLKYCQDYLNKRNKADKYQMEDKVKNELHEKRMNSKDDESFDFK